MNRLVRWLMTAWREPGLRASVIGQYSDLGRLEMVLADIAVRGSVFAPADPSIDLRIAEGRRQMALEILRLANADHRALMTLCFQPQKDKPDA